MTKSSRGNEGLVVPVSGCFTWAVVNSVIVNGVNVKYTVTPTKPMCGSSRGITLLSWVVELKKLELLFLVSVACTTYGVYAMDAGVITSNNQKQIIILL